MDEPKSYYDGAPIIPPEIKKMTQKELDKEWEKIVKKHKQKDTQ